MLYRRRRTGVQDGRRHTHTHTFGVPIRTRARLRFIADTRSSSREMADLNSMDVDALRQRAASVGVPDQQIEDARDADHPQSELIALIT
eukprot:COSAG01_NODE_50303_length_364_cov_1.000000_1_plen_88_part_01